ncbi:MAG TPA: hypothetical protein VLG69_00900 [Candidatus Andersenbacteria bacterium]|nr:hypothetical protein [Candidatus Andersenbacteria bacterium]
MKNVWVCSGVVIVIAAGIAFAALHSSKTQSPVSSPMATPVQYTGWKTMTDSAQHISFQYPPTLQTTYIHTVDWPPKIQILNNPLTCTQAQQRTIDGHTYCVTVISEGAAGSIYNQYAYAFSQDTKTVILTFTLQLVQCANYDQPQQQACQTERSQFNSDTIADQIAQTVGVTQ